MGTKFEAIYEAGVLRPVQPLNLTEHSRVTLQLAEAVTNLDDILDHSYMERARQRVAKMSHIPTLEEIQELLSSDPGSWSDAIIEARSDR